jgi:Zn-finger protein
MKRIRRVNVGCRFFPCHRELEDCTFCYCPFYPCLNEKLGEYVYSKKAGEKIWDCQHCVWIHKKSVVDKVFRIIRENKDKIFPGTRCFDKK